MRYTILGFLLLVSSSLFSQQITSLSLFPQEVKAEDGSSFYQAMVVVNLDDATDLSAVQVQLGTTAASNDYFDGLFFDSGESLPPDTHYRRVGNTIVIRLGQFSPSQMSVPVHLCARLEGASDLLGTPQTTVWQP